MDGNGQIKERHQVRIGINPGLFTGMFIQGNIVEFAVSKGLPRDARCVGIAFDQPDPMHPGIIVLYLESAEFAPVPEGEQPPFMDACIAQTSHMFEALTVIADGMRNENNIDLVLTRDEMIKIARTAAGHVIKHSGRLSEPGVKKI